ncbi:MAG: adenylosuccinate lyase [Opitutales bacterium]
MDALPNILAQRYASKAMRHLWSPVGRIVRERQLWLAVLHAQKNHGIAIPEGAIEAYTAQLEQVDLDDIQRRERISRHDVKARIESFNAQAGFECIHQGMTSRDLTENVEQLLLRAALQLLREKAVAALLALGAKAQAFKELRLTARTHNVPAQSTTLGRRFAMWGEELRLALEGLDAFIEPYPLRGLKGAVGTQTDPANLFDQQLEKVAPYEAAVTDGLGFNALLQTPGQVYPRSLDCLALSHLYALGSAPASFAKTWRLMSGQGLVSEGFAKGQTGSSAMPHKVNARSCERLNGLHVILRGYLTMAEGLAGDQWNEGDVSCSVVRRVALPDACFALDGLLETFLTVLGQLEVFERAITEEYNRQVPFLLTTGVLMQAVKAGVGRETAHEAIKQHALNAAQALREGATLNPLFDALARDDRLQLSAADLQSILDDNRDFVGLAREQTDTFLNSLAPWRTRFPNAAAYAPEPSL